MAYNTDNKGKLSSLRCSFGWRCCHACLPPAAGRQGRQDFCNRQGGEQIPFIAGRYGQAVKHIDRFFNRNNLIDLFT